MLSKDATSCFIDDEKKEQKLSNSTLSKENKKLSNSKTKNCPYLMENKVSPPPLCVLHHGRISISVQPHKLIIYNFIKIRTKLTIFFFFLLFSNHINQNQPVFLWNICVCQLDYGHSRFRFIQSQSHLQRFNQIQPFTKLINHNKDRKKGKEKDRNHVY